MAYTITPTPAGGTKVGTGTPSDPAAAASANQYMTNWESQNPTGYKDTRSFEVSDPQGYANYQSNQAKAFNQWQQQYYAPSGNTGIVPPSYPNTGIVNAAANVGNTNSGNTMPGIIASAQQPTYTMAPQQASSGGVVSKNISGGVDANGNITNVDTYNAAQVGDPTKWNVGSEQTMQGQLQNFMSQDNPLLQMARSRAINQMNERGLSNSSLAIGAADAAAYDTALPIAQNDAGVYANSAQFNANTANQFALQNAGWINQALAQNASEANKAYGTNATNLTSRLNQQLQSQTQKDVANIGLEGTKYSADKDYAGRVYASDRSLEGTKYSADQSLAGTRYASDNSLKGTMYSADQSLAGTKYSADTQKELGYLNANTQTNIANMSNATQIAVQNLQGQYNAQIQASNAANQYFQNMTSQIAAIDRDPNLSVDGKQNAIQRQLDLAPQAFSILRDVNDIPNLGAYYTGLEVGGGS